MLATAGTVSASVDATVHNETDGARGGVLDFGPTGIGDSEETTMRLTAGGCYEIEGAELRRVSNVAPGPGAADSWRDRQADLWTESSALIHVHHPLTDEELGLLSLIHISEPTRPY